MDLIQVGSVVVEGQLLQKARPCIGLIVRLDESSKLPVVKALHGGQTLIKLPSLPQPTNAADTPLIYHLASLANTRKAQFQGKVEKIDNGVATLRLDVLLPEWIVDGSRSLPKTSSAAKLLLHMIPLADSNTLAEIDVGSGKKEIHEEEEDEDDSSLNFLDAEPAETRTLSCLDALKLTAGIPQDYSTTKASSEVYSLRNCVLSIPSTKETPPTTEVLKRRSEDKATPSLALLPEKALVKTLKMCDSDSLQAVACTCKYLRHQAAEIGPCIKLDLFEHQRAALRWMLQRELPSKPIPHPTIRRFSTSIGTTLWGSTATGETQTTPQQLFDFRGGFFCDEPGLGKTITILSLILRTKGLLPDTPDGVEMTWFQSPELDSRENRKIGFYTISTEDAVGISKLERAKSTVVRRSLRNTQHTSRIGGGSGDASGVEEERKEEEAGLAQAAATTVNEEEGAAAGAAEESSVKVKAEVKKEEEKVEEIKQEIREDEKVEGCAALAGSKRQRVDVAGAFYRRGGSSKRTIACEDDMILDLTTPPPKESGLADPGDSRGVGEGSSDFSRAAGGGRAVAVDTEQVNNQWGRQVRRHIAFATSSEDVEQEEDSSDIENINAGASEAEAVEEDIRPDPSIGCDLCSKWRRLPKQHHPEDENAPWCCYLHPLASYRSCSVPCDSDAAADEHLVASPGWVGFDDPEDAKLLQENIDFFRSLLDKYKHLRFCTPYYGQRTPTPIPAMKLLIESNCRKISEIGFAFSKCMGEELGTGYGQFLSDIGFIPAPKSTCRSHGLPAQKRNGNDIPKVEKSQQDWARWVTPIKLSWRMVLDQKALKEAITQGPKPQGHRIYLSPATLIVVPTELIQHWKDQIHMHTTSGALRVAVYDSKSNPLSSFKGSTPVLPQVLAFEYDVVITTFNKMSSDWKPENPLLCSPLTQVHWLRIVLDEGHTIGANLGNVTSKLQMAASLRAERRWVMTGTPAPSTPTAGTITLKYMQPLLSFLHDEAMGGSTAFNEAIDKQLKDCPAASRWRLQSALKRCLIRASKKEILGECKITPVLLDFTPSHAQSYNFLVDIIKANMLLCDFNDPDHTQSLLSGSTEKRANQALINTAQSCNVAGNILLQVQSKDLHSTLESVAAKNAYPPPAPIDFGEPFCGGDHPLRTQEEGLMHGGVCKSCENYVRAPILTPCACLLCVHCAEKQRTQCPHCSTPYLMQSVHDPARKRDAKGELNPNPKWDVPFELIEWQPAFAQLGAIGEGEGNWQEDWKHTDSSKITYLLGRLRALEALPPSNWDPNDWGNNKNASTWPPPVPDGCGPPKAIVFTQHAIHARLLINRIKEPYPEGCVKTFHKNMGIQEKTDALKKFENDPLCRVLIMDQSGSHGLDLSFVQHVFLMEPIINKSLEEQVVSRAWRLGLKEQVHAEVFGYERHLRGRYFVENWTFTDKRAWHRRRWWGRRRVGSRG
ncbi:hypothetical protein Ndes2526B_g02263 [Nannochloris sp. 'desiccata']